MQTTFSSWMYRIDRLSQRFLPAAGILARTSVRLSELAREGDLDRPAPPSFCPDERVFFAQLRADVLAHLAVNHPLLARLACSPFVREDYRIFGLQYFVLVGSFPTYLEHLLLRAPSSDAKKWLATGLLAEYTTGPAEKDRVELYRQFLHATGSPSGEELETPLHDDVTGFIREHLRICRDEPFLVGLGAVGPGHAMGIPRMFAQILQGLRQARFRDEEIGYFLLDAEQDTSPGAWIEDALASQSDTPEAQAQIYRGAMLSLAARTKLWSGVQDKMVRWRQPGNVHLRAQARLRGHLSAGEMTLGQWRVRARELCR